MIYGIQDLLATANQTQVKLPYGYAPARPVWTTMGRWRHAWWVLTGRCDAIWWPEDGNPCRRAENRRGDV